MGRKPLILELGPGSGDVDVVVGGVDVAADDDMAVGVAPCVDEGEEGVVETHFVVEALFVLFAVGEVDVEDGEVWVFGDEDAAFFIEFWDAEAGVNLEWFEFLERVATPL